MRTVENSRLEVSTHTWIHDHASNRIKSHQASLANVARCGMVIATNQTRAPAPSLCVLNTSEEGRLRYQSVTNGHHHIMVGKERGSIFFRWD